METEGPSAFAPLAEMLEALRTAPDAERSALFATYMRRLRREFPGHFNLIRLGAVDHGAFLALVAHSAFTSAHGRAELTEAEKQEVSEDFADVVNGISYFNNREGEFKSAAHKVIMAALFLGMRAGLSHNESERLRAAWLKERQSAVAKKSAPARKTKWDWRPHATELVAKARARDSNLKHSEVARAVFDDWNQKVVRRPAYKTIERFVLGI
jgi:hypothetical protein